MRHKRFVITTIAALYFGVVIGLAFVPASEQGRSFWFWPFAAFVPVGVLLALLMGRRRWWVAVGFGLLGAAWLEAGQAIWMPDGYSNFLDVIWSSTGVIAGVAIVVVATELSRRSMRSHEAPRIIAQAGNREIPQD